MMPPGLIALFVIAVFIAGLCSVVVYVAFGHRNPFGQILLLVIVILIIAGVYVALRF
jgi:hypothetical protein